MDNKKVFIMIIGTLIFLKKFAKIIQYLEGYNLVKSLFSSNQKNAKLILIYSEKIQNKNVTN